MRDRRGRFLRAVSFATRGSSRGHADQATVGKYDRDFPSEPTVRGSVARMDHARTVELDPAFSFDQFAVKSGKAGLTPSAQLTLEKDGLSLRFDFDRQGAPLGFEFEWAVGEPVESVLGYRRRCEHVFAEHDRARSAVGQAHEEPAVRVEDLDRERLHRESCPSGSPGSVTGPPSDSGGDAGGSWTGMPSGRSVTSTASPSTS